MKRHAVAVARQGDIGAVAIQARRREEMGAVDGYPLRLVDRPRVAMIEIAIRFDVECDPAPAITAQPHARFADTTDRPRPHERRAGSAYLRPRRHRLPPLD